MLSPDMITTAPAIKIFRGPDGKMYPDAWWDTPEPPEAHRSQDVIPSLITQIAETEEDGKQSCFLTSQLNALIATGRIDTTTAEALQTEFSTDSTYSQFWVPWADGSQRAWTPKNPHGLAFLLNQAGIRIATEPVQVTDAAADLTPYLSSGNVAVITGRSQAGYAHSRFAFEPLETPGMLYVHDPKYPEVSGQYSYDRLPELQVTNLAIIF